MILACALATASPAAGAGIDHAHEYDACLHLARRAPAEALAAAAAWQAAGGGNAARHCAAMALFHRGDFREAAVDLNDLADELAGVDGRLAADLYIQAGKAWVLAEAPERALTALDAAIGIGHHDPEIHVARSYAHAARGDYQAAVDDLDAAAALAPRRAEVYLLRGAARRFLADYDLALDDLERALALAPRNAEVYLERGNVRRLTGDRDGARADWQRAARMAPDTPTGAAAEANLVRLDGEAP